MSQSNGRPEPIKNYYIAYFDLLGYKDFFKSHPDKVEEFLSAIHDSISSARRYIQEINSSFLARAGQLAINVKIFSDNILLCMETGSEKAEPIEYPRFLAFLSIVADIQRNFILNYGLFLRGAVTIGSLSFNKDFIFGQGLIDAVQLEGAAIYPRIIISDTALDFIDRAHFIKQSDLDRVCDIEKRSHSGEIITDEDLSFYNFNKSAANMERFYSKWRDGLLLNVFDRFTSLNYLYCVNISNILDASTRAQLLTLLAEIAPHEYQNVVGSSRNLLWLLDRHRHQIIQKIEEFGQYNDINLSSPDAAKAAELREHILKKYLWVMMVHNFICIQYNAPEYRIKSGSTCDIRFMRMTTEIFEDKPSDDSSTENQFSH